MQTPGMNTAEPISPVRPLAMNASHLNKEKLSLYKHNQKYNSTFALMTKSTSDLSVGSPSRKKSLKDQAWGTNKSFNAIAPKPQT